MRTKIKRLTTIIALLLLCTIFLSCMGGCGKKDSNRFYTELFSCKYNKDKSGVIILELTEKGQEQEILVIPEEINGLPVVQLGGSIGYPNRPIEIRSKKLKKMYIDNDYYISLESVYFDQPIEIVAMNNQSFIHIVLSAHHFSYSAKCYTTEEIFILNYESIGRQTNFKDFDLVAVGNIAFIEISDDEEKTIWLDNISENGVYYCPYIEREWYLDRACTIPWDKNYKLEVGQEKISVYSQKA